MSRAAQALVLLCEVALAGAMAAALWVALMGCDGAARDREAVDECERFVAMVCTLAARPSQTYGECVASAPKCDAESLRARGAL